MLSSLAPAPTAWLPPLPCACAGRSVLVLEGAGTVGGGLRSAELTLPGFVHDPCSAFTLWASHRLCGVACRWPSTAWRGSSRPRPWPSVRRWHGCRGGADVAATAGQLGGDARAYRRLIRTFAGDWERIIQEFLGPLRFPRHPFCSFASAWPRCGLLRRWPGSHFAANGRAVFAGMSAHSIMPLEWPATAAFGFMLGILAHAVGWPIVQGGSQRFADALASYFRSLGGEIVTGNYVRTLADLPPTAAALLRDAAPAREHRGRPAAGGLSAAARSLPARAGRLQGGFRTEWPIPWRVAECLRAGTIHVGGTLAEIATAERAAWQGEHYERPFLIFGQQSLFDPTGARGKHTVWAYCHVPNGSTVDMTGRIEAQIERFAPGFRDASWPAARGPPPRWPRTTPTTSAATSTAACKTCASSTPGRWPA